MKEIDPVNLSAVFTEHSKLHLLCWNMADLSVHSRGMELLATFLSDDDYANILLPMIRSRGRGNLETYSCHEDSYGDLGQKDVDYVMWGNDYSHCELWIQCARDVESKVWSKLANWIDENQHGLAFKGLTNPIWRPFGSSLEKADYYPKTCSEYKSEHKNEGQPRFITQLVKPVDIPWLMKLIWGRASWAILEILGEDGRIRLIDPSAERDTVKDLLRACLSDFDPTAWGLPALVPTFGPTRLGVAHMTVHALHSVSNTRPDPYSILHHYPAVRDPFCFPDLESMLRTF